MPSSIRSALSFVGSSSDPESSESLSVLASPVALDLSSLSPEACLPEFSLEDEPSSVVLSFLFEGASSADLVCLPFFEDLELFSVLSLSSPSLAATSVRTEDELLKTGISCSFGSSISSGISISSFSIEDLCIFPLSNLCMRVSI